MTDEQLERVANEVRKGVLVATHAAKSGHPGGSLSAADILTYLYFEEMNVDPADPQKATRRRACTPRSPSGATSPRRTSRPCATSAATCRATPT